MLLDVNLGQENGLDVLTEILKAQPHLPVVMFTAQGNVKNAVETMRRGGFSGGTLWPGTFPDAACKRECG